MYNYITISKTIGKFLQLTLCKRNIYSNIQSNIQKDKTQYYYIDILVVISRFYKQFDLQTRKLQPQQQVLIRDVVITELDKNNAAASKISFIKRRRKGLRKQPRCKIIEHTISHATAHISIDWNGERKSRNNQVRPFDLQNFEHNSTLQTRQNLLSDLVCMASVFSHNIQQFLKLYR